MSSIHLEGDPLLDAELRVGPMVSARALVRALRRAIDSARTFMARSIAQDMGLPVGEVRDNLLKIKYPSEGNPTAQLSTSLKRIPLMKFRASGPRPSHGKGRGVSYRLPGGRGRNPHAFIATMRSGHEGVFRRVAKPRLPIVELYGPSVGRVFDKYRAQGQARAIEAFDKNFDHELNFERSRRGA